MLKKKQPKGHNKTLTELPPMPPGVSAGRIHSWDNRSKDHRACPVCEADRPVGFVKRPDQLVVHQCGGCGMYYAAEVPGENELGKFYGSYAKQKYQSATNRLPWKRFHALRNPYLSILERTGGVKGKAICEVGCSFGYFLDLIRFKGGRPFGVEVDQGAFEMLNKKRIPVSRTLHGKVVFDVVCAFDLLEHLPAPRRMIRDMAGSIRSDGRLLLTFPNGDEVDRCGPAWVGFRVDLEHVNYFRLQDITRLMLDYGFYVEHYWERVQPYLSRPSDRETANHKGMFNLFKRIKAKADGFVFEKGRYNLVVLARKV